MKLELVYADPEKTPLVLEQFPVILGLDRAADIRLDDSSIGHYQCMIDEVESGLMVWDLGTKLGTWVNGVRVEKRAMLRPGDELTIGRTRFTVEYGDPLRRPRRQPRHAASTDHGEALAAR